jgi:hypothetical protein
MKLSIFLIQASIRKDEIWGSLLSEVDASKVKPIVLWSDEDLYALRGTQVYETAVQYRYGEPYSPYSNDHCNALRSCSGAFSPWSRAFSPHILQLLLTCLQCVARYGDTYLPRHKT